MGPKRRGGGRGGGNGEGGGPTVNSRGPTSNSRGANGGGGGGGGNQGGGRGRRGRGFGRGGGGNVRHPPSSAQAPSAAASDVPLRMRQVSECGDDHCPVCLSLTTYFAVGRCQHHICHECSTRLRILCNQHECPICRQENPKVVFTHSKRNFDDVAEEPYLIDRRHGICFESQAIRRSYDVLLNHACPVDAETCGAFKTFEELDRHVRRQHELFYCDLCVRSLTKFSHERRLYTRGQLATHKRKGDPDDTSQRGHPVCPAAADF
jgi:hypothetical protein